MKKKTITAISSLGAISGVALLATSCGTAAADKLDGKYIADARKDGKTLTDSEIAFDKFYNQLIANGQSENAKRVQDIIKKSARWLYEKEVKGSEHLKEIREAQMTKKEKKDADLQALKSLSKIESSVRSEFDDQKEAFKQAHGHGYEDAWKTELSTNKAYGNATSDKQAIDNMVLKQIVGNAYAQHTIKQDSDTFTKEDVERGNPANKDSKQKDWEWLWNLKQKGYVFPSEKDSTYAGMEKTQKVIVVSTGSQNVDLKDPSALFGEKGGHGYINKYDPMVVNHFLLPAVPDANKSMAPWKVKIEDAKKWLMSIEPKGKDAKPAIDNLETFKGLQYGQVDDPKTKKKMDFGVTESDEILLKLLGGNQAGTKKTGGSLGMMDELSYVQSMDPGFGLPLLNEEIKGDKFEVVKTNPLKGLGTKILNALQQSVDKTNFKGDKDSKLWAKNLQTLFDLVGENDAPKIIGRVFRDAFGDTRADKQRALAYKIADATATEPARYVVTSKFGVHIISDKKITDADDMKKMMQSDVMRATNGDGAYFNVISEVNKHSNDKMLIVKSLLNDSDFTKWLKDQPNYNGIADGDSYPDYTDADIKNLQETAVKGYEQTLSDTRAESAVAAVRPWVNSAFHNETLFVNSKFIGKLDDEIKFWNKSLEDIYNTAVGIASEGAVK
ncbi:HinT-interacting membrane complex protein P80 [Mycoplasma todarodis]|uniref:HinT-interacting membrane complex protein P80 n=1 Tax=Mycoplasma todarodis TaxID=1937191 RepID=UPI003B2C7D18